MNARRSMRFLVALFVCTVAAVSVPASAATCPSNPEALGTSRVLTINPSEFTLLGTIDYEQTLPLKDHEVVITFDDGPLPPYTDIILDTLASQCVKATYFLVGQMAHAYPSVVRRIYNEGHTIGSDIHRATAMALPILLKELKANGYEVVHVVAEGEQPKSVPEPMALPTTDGKASPTVLTSAPRGTQHRIKKHSASRHYPAHSYYPSGLIEDRMSALGH